MSGLFSLEGRTAVVTGARRGIGLAMAEALAAAGADIVAVSAAQEAAGSEVERRVTALGRRCTTHRLDLADREAVSAFTGAITADRCPDILVNNAGVIVRAPAEQLTDADWDRVLEVDLTAQFRLAREIGRAMLARGSGKIIFTASLLSFQGGVNVAAVHRREVRPGRSDPRPGQRVGGPRRPRQRDRPGLHRHRQQHGVAGRPGPVRRHPGPHPGRPVGTREDLAGPTVFLASSASDYVHGALLPVDGGWLGR